MCAFHDSVASSPPLAPLHSSVTTGLDSLTVLDDWHDSEVGWFREASGPVFGVVRDLPGDFVAQKKLPSREELTGAAEARVLVRRHSRHERYLHYLQVAARLRLDN